MGDTGGGDRWSALQSVVALSRYHLVNSKLPTNAKAITQHKRQKLLIICECFGGCLVAAGCWKACLSPQGSGSNWRHCVQLIASIRGRQYKQTN